MAKSKQRVNALLKFKFNLKARINLYKKLKGFTEQHFPIYESLVKFKTRYDKKKDYRGKMIGIWLENMKHGANFNTAIKGWVPESELNLIAAGEDGNGIEKGLGEAIKFATSSQKIKKTIISGAAYPTVLFLLVLGFIAMFSLQLAPTYLGLLPIERWPTVGYYFYYFSKFLVDYWFILGGSLISFIYFIAKTIPTWTGRTREYFDKLPPWSVYKVYQSSAFLISLSSMMQSSITLNDALKRIKKTSSAWVGYYIDEMLKNLRRGGTRFGQHLDVGLLDDETAGDVIDYSDLGNNFEEAIYTIGEQNLEDNIEKITLQMNIAKNLMIMFVGVTIALIYATTIQLNTVVAEAASASTTATLNSSGTNK